MQSGPISPFAMIIIYDSSWVENMNYFRIFCAFARIIFFSEKILGPKTILISVHTV